MPLMEYGNLIHCPIYGRSKNGGEIDYCHVIRTVLSESDTGGAWKGRGDVDIMTFHGECGHVWDLCIGFHKGQSYMFVSTPYGSEMYPFDITITEDDVIIPKHVVTRHKCRVLGGDIWMMM